MKRLIATAAVCGVSLFGFTAVAGAAGSPGNPTPNPNGPAHGGTACQEAGTRNPVLQPVTPPNLGISYLEGVGTVFCIGPS